MISAAMPPSSNCNLIVWLRSPAQRQQNCRNQQQSAERQPHPSFGQAAGERDASGDRRDATKCERQSDKPIDPTGPGIRQQRQERARGNERQRQTLRLQLPQPEERRQQRRRNEGTTDPEQTREHAADKPNDRCPAPGSRRRCPNSDITAPQAVGHSDGDGGEKNSEGEPQDMRVEAGRETGCRVGGNQSRPGYSRRHAHIDAEASLVPRKCPNDIGHPPLSGRCPARSADPSHRKTPRSGITRKPPPTPNSPPSRPAIPPRPAAAAARITVAIMRADDAGEHRRIESAGSEILPARTVSALATVPRSRDTDQGDQSNPILSASGSG